MLSFLSIIQTSGIQKLLANEDGPHIALTPEKITEIAGFTISNSFIYGIITAFVLGVVLFIAKKNMRLKAVKGITQFIEIIVEFVIGLIEGPLGSRKKAVKYAPIFGTFLLFIIFSNILGLLPIVGPGVFAKTAEGNTALFRPFTADLNATLAMSIIAIFIVQYLSIKESGFLGHLKHYFTDKPLNPINAFIGLLEVFGELTRVMSLSLRLFLNTAVGEILISVFAYIGKDFRSFTILPIVMFEILVAGIQAYVFTVLCATYLGQAISHGHDDEHPAHEVDPVVSAIEGEVVSH
ncbi:F0F1 ATP synthase subunit A [Candidatus Saccharibacteria bacterium]|nr:F0F1 ATP synthase subunit A [Candidatus Saccharibacteria bacterium]